jgi:hypothetical protein
MDCFLRLVGKTCLVFRFVLRKWVIEYDPTIDEEHFAGCVIDGWDMRLLLLDYYTNEVCDLEFRSLSLFLFFVDDFYDNTCLWNFVFSCILSVSLHVN